MKLSISLPDEIAQEIRRIAQKTEKSVSSLLGRAWHKSRIEILRDEEKAKRSHIKAMKLLDSLRGSLKKDFPETDSMTLSHRAFQDTD